MSQYDIIGISGLQCSGKDFAAEYIAREYGYLHISTGDILRARAKELGLDMSRRSLQALGYQLRKENDGRDPLLLEALSSLSGNTVLTGIRTLDAARSIIDAPGRLLYIEAPLEVRFERSVSRARVDHVSMDEFIINDQIEHYGAEDTDMSLFAVKSIASRVICNHASEESYRQLLRDFVES
ncbi:MAG: AAA family ATPase [Candidatus Saccharibacteria bacterium]|nr:AAA family ATPase [Candidatus Saccharibacteria bacterium]